MTASRPDPPVVSRDLPSAAEGRSAQASAPRTRLVVASALAGLLLGALCGAVLLGLRAPVVSATALVALRPDPLVASGGTGQLSDAQANSFLQTEVLFLGGPEFRRLVQERLGTPEEPVIEATRLQESETVQLRVEAGSEANAVTTADAAAEVYAQRRTDQVTERLDAQIETVGTQLAAAQKALDELPAAPEGTVNSVSVQRAAAEARYTTLLTVSDELLVARGAAGTVVRTVQSGYVEPRSGLSPAVAGALGGGALGVLVTVGTVVVARRFSRRIGGPEDLNRYEVPVLSPEVPFRRVGPTEVAHPAVQSVVATHAPRLAGERDSRPGLVLVGGTSGVGTSYLALQHALYSARRAPTLLVRVSDADDALVALALGVDPAHADLAALPGGSVVSTAALRPLVQESEVPGLWVLSHRAEDEAALAALEQALERGLVEAGLDAGWQVVVDAPALDRSTAGLLAARRCGSAVLVVASGRTRRAEVERALDTFASWGVALTGVVTNRAPRASRSTPAPPSPPTRRARESVRARTT